MEKPKVRLYVDQPLGAGQAVALGADAANYLFNVMRLGRGAVLALFNGRDGEWLAEVAEAGKRQGIALCQTQPAPQVMPPDLWLLFTPVKKDRTAFIVEKAVELEYRYAEDTMPRGVLGLNASMFKGYLRYIANRRATQIGLEPLFANEENPFPWMSEMIDLKKERNFFETRVIEYQSGGALSWD